MTDVEYQPLKGDPTVLKAKAAHYAEIADAIQRSVTTLGKIHDMTGMKSKAVESLKSMSKDVADDITKAHDRYSKTAAALSTYSGPLRDAQSDAEAAITQINAKQTAADSAHKAAKTAQQTADDATGQDAATAQSKATSASHNATSADAELAAAQQKWHDAVDKKNTAAETAINAIVDVVDHHNNGLTNPSWWDNFVSVVEKIGDIAGVLAIFLSWVPILGQVLLVIAAVASIIKLIDSVVKFANGEGTFLDILGAAVGTVLTLFGGRIFTFLGKVARFRSLTRAPSMMARAGSDVRVAARLRAGQRAMSNATKDLFKVPSYASRSAYLTAVKESFTKSGEAERAAYKALFTGGSSRLSAAAKLAGIDQSVVRAVRDDIVNGYKDPIAAAAAFHQVEALYNKAAGIANVPGAIQDIFTGKSDYSVPSLNLTNLGVGVANKIAPTFISPN